MGESYLISYSISSHNLMWIIGIIMSQIYYVAIGKKYHIKFPQSLFTGIMILFFEIVSAKILFILENINNFSVEYFSLASGYSLYGVFIFMPIFLMPISKIIFNKNLLIMDFASIGILIELAFYRIGCYISGCCGGIEISGFGAFPVQIIELVFDLLISTILLIIALRKNQFNNFLFSYVYILYGILRFILEFLRIRENILFAFSISHFLSIITIIIGLTIIIVTNKKKYKNN